MIAAAVGSNQPMPISNRGSTFSADTSTPATFAPSIRANSSDTNTTTRYATFGLGKRLRKKVRATNAIATGYSANNTGTDREIS